MRRGAAIGNVAQRVAQRSQIADLSVKIIGAGVQFGTVQIGDAITTKHRANFGKGKTSRFAQRDQGQAQHRVRPKLTAMSVARLCGDQADVIVVAQG